MSKRVVYFENQKDYISLNFIQPLITGSDLETNVYCRYLLIILLLFQNIFLKKTIFILYSVDYQLGFFYQNRFL